MHANTKIFSIFLIIAPILFQSQQLQAKIINICPDCEIKQIERAISIASPGDTVLVQAGKYEAHDILIKKAITLIGKGLPVIDGKERGHIFKVAADDVTIEGFKLINVKMSYTSEYAAVHTSKIQRFVFKNNVIENAFFGFLIEKSHNGKIINNTIIGDAVKEQDSGNGIHLWYSSKIQIENNHIEGMRDGIYFEFVKHCMIRQNTSRKNVRYGLHFMFSNDDRYEQNIFEQNGAGVAVMFSKNISMRKNIFRRNWGTASYGLLLKEINDAEIIGNTFTRNTIGINAEGSNRITYERNNFQNNGWAIRFLGACYGNKLLRNNFLHNALDISYKGMMNGNIFDKNYWSGYSGYDLDRDRFGDVPYRPVKLFSYIVNQTPETIILLRSLFIDIINFSEKVSPIFTPDNLKDMHPQMKPILQDDLN